MKRFLGLSLVLAVFAAAFGAAPATAYRLAGYHFDHTAITYSCSAPPEFRAALQEWIDVSGLSDGGCRDLSPDVAYRGLEVWPYATNVLGVTGCQSSDGVALRCFIAVPKAPDSRRFAVLVHEWGHALGLGHSSESLAEPSVLYSDAAMFAYCCNDLNADDIAGIQALYGAPAVQEPTLFRLFVPAVAR